MNIAGEQWAIACSSWFDACHLSLIRVRNVVATRYRLRHSQTAGNN